MDRHRRVTVGARPTVARDASAAPGWPSRVAIAALLGLVVTAAAYGVRYVYTEVPLLPFKPVCRDYNRYDSNIDTLRSVNGASSQEFMRDLRSWYQQFLNDGWVAIRNGTVLLRPQDYFSTSEALSKFGGQSEEVRYYVTARIARAIYKRRIAEGVITEDSLAMYRVRRGPYMSELTEPAFMYPDECGLLEELVLRDGVFASK